MEKEDLRVIKTKRRLKEAFEVLLLHKTYEKITIKDLCDKAMVNRKTFYLHYSTIDDILKEIELDLTKEFYERVNTIDYVKDAALLAKEYYKFTEEKGILVQKINASPSLDYIRMAMVNNMQKLSQENTKSIEKYDENTQKLILSLISNIILSAYRIWIYNEKALSIDELNNITSTLLTNGLKPFIEA
jgi:AcrR family transcriptional regulator